MLVKAHAARDKVEKRFQGLPDKAQSHDERDWRLVVLWFFERRVDTW